MRLKKRRDFLAVAQKGRSVAMPTVVVQWLENPNHNKEGSALRLGYTASRRVGNAVIRNLSRRRLKEITHAYFKEHAQTSGDMVLIARHSTSKADFLKIKTDFCIALQKLGA